MSTGSATSKPLNQPRRFLFPEEGDTWESIAARECAGLSQTEAVNLLQSWNLHVFMRPAAPADSSRRGNPILPSDVIFLEPPAE